MGTSKRKGAFGAIFDMKPGWSGNSGKNSSQGSKPDSGGEKGSGGGSSAGKATTKRGSSFHEDYLRRTAQSRKIAPLPPQTQRRLINQYLSEREKNIAPVKTQPTPWTMGTNRLDEMRSKWATKPVSDGLTTAERNRNIADIEKQIREIDGLLARNERGSAYLGQAVSPETTKNLLLKRQELGEALVQAKAGGEHTEAELLSRMILNTGKTAIGIETILPKGYAANPAAGGNPDIAKAHAEALRQWQGLENQQEQMDYFLEYDGKTHEGGFWGQSKGNYDLGRMSQDSSEAWSEYLDNPTEENRKKAESIDQLMTQFQTQNEETLTEDGKLSIISKDIANYLPQFLDQMKYQAAGTAIAAPLALVLGSPKLMQAGAVLGSGAYSQKTMRGAAFKALLEAGVDEETARKAAKDEAVISSMIEMGDTALDLFTMGGGKLLGAITKGGSKALAESIAKAAGKNALTRFGTALGKYGLNVFGEGLQEGVQGAISVANREREQRGIDGKLDLIGEAAKVYWDAKTDKESQYREEINEQEKGGRRIAAVMGLAEGSVNAVGSKVVDNVKNKPNKNEQTVVEKLVEERIAEKEKDGKKITGKEKSKIYEDVVRDMEKGRISTDDIERILGGDTYKEYKKTVDSEDALKKELDELRNMKQGDMNDIQQDRLAELKGMNLDDTTKRDSLKARLGQEVSAMVKSDRLAESYNERGRRGQAFQADVSKYDAKQRATIQKAIDSGILNNTGRSHEFVDMVAKISADKGVSFDFTNNEKLKGSIFAVEGKTVNGYVNKDGMTVNIQSAKALNNVVGHEITHVLEGTDLYKEFQTALFNYAETKKDLQSRRSALEELYKDVKGTDIDAELTADLVGDYLFTDQDFVNHLSTSNRNVFQKIFDEIKYLCKVAGAGSKEARELERVKRVFEEAYRQEGKVPTETKYSLGDLDFPRTMVDYTDTDTRRSLEESKVNDLIARGKETTIQNTPAEIAATDWNDRKNARDCIKGILKQFLGKDMVFSHEGQSAVAYLTDKGLGHASAGENTAVKAAALSEFYSLVSNAEYCYSSESHSHSKTVGREDWDYFVSVSKVGEETVPVVFAVRTIDQDTRSQIYSIATKKNPTIPHGDGTQKNSANAHPVFYRDSSSSLDNITPPPRKVNPKRSISESGKQLSQVGNWNIRGEDVMLGPIRKEAKAGKTPFSTPIREDIKAKGTVPTNVNGGPLGPVPGQDTKHVAEQLGQTATEAQTAGNPAAEETGEKLATKPVTEKIKAQIESSQKELENVQTMRQAAADDYRDQLSKALMDYESRKNKNTKAANDVLRRIERIKRMKADVDAAYESRIDKIAKRLEKLQSPQYSRAEQRMEKQNTFRQEISDMIGDISTWVDKKMGLSYQTNTLKRNLRDIVRDATGKSDIAKADKIYDYLQGAYNTHEAELKRESADIKKPFQDMKINRHESEYIQMRGELQGNPETMLTEADVEDFYKKYQGKIDKDKCQRAIDEARKVYDDLFDRVNKVLREHGMKEIGYRQGYFPHFTKDKQGPIAKVLNWKNKDGSIPTDIAGMTENFNPQRSWQGFNKERKTDITDYDFTEGFDTYVHGALDWVYHIEDIQKRRAFEDEIRYRHSEKGVQEKIDQINADHTLDADEAQERRDAVYAEANNPLGNFLVDFHNGTNGLAGKKSNMDRSMEYATNRQIYSMMTNITNRVSANMVAANIASAMTNVIPITQSWSQVSIPSSIRGMADTIRSTFSSDGLAEKSTFLTNRLMEEEKVRKGFWDHANDAAGAMMGVVDGFTSETVWRSKYYENIQKGMSENAAIRNADSFAAGLMADRSRGNMPTIFDAKNPAIKMLTAFQLEVANQYGYMLKDMPQDMAKEGVGKLVGGYAKMFVGAYLYNKLSSAITGRDSAFDPIGILEDLMKDLGFDLDDDDDEEEVDVVGALTNLGENVAQEIPFVGGLLGGGRVPISAAMPYNLDVGNMLDDIEGMIKEEDKGRYKDRFLDEIQKPFFYGIMPMGGGQLQKSLKGLGMFRTNEKHPIAGSYTTSGNLRFPVEATAKNVIQAGLFGQYANGNARKYFDEERSPMTPEQVKIFQSLDVPIEDYWKFQDDLSDFHDIRNDLYKTSQKDGATDVDAVKNSYINSIYYDISDLQEEQKKILDSDASEEEKREEIRELQSKITKLVKAGRQDIKDFTPSANYAKVNDREYIKNAHGTWKEASEAQLKAQEQGTEALGIAPGKYWEVRSAVTAKADAENATQEDKLRGKFIDYVVNHIYGLNDDIEAIEESDLPEWQKQSQIIDIQEQIQKFGAEHRKYFSSDLDVHITNGNLASVGNSKYYQDDKGAWKVIYYNNEIKQQKISKAFGISESEYWKKHKEYDFAYSNIDRYNKMMEYGVSFEEYTQGGTEIAKLVSDDYEVFERISDDMYNIDAKDENMRSVSGLKKKRVTEYINSLNLDEGVKWILFKDQYPSDKKHDQDIIDYLNERSDISGRQMRNILLGLGALVDEEGYVYWQ